MEIIKTLAVPLVVIGCVALAYYFMQALYYFIQCLKRK